MILTGLETLGPSANEFGVPDNQIPGVGHLTSIETPELFTDAVRQFLERHAT